MHKPISIRDVSGFKILSTTTATQTAVMTLEPGEASSADLNKHSHSEQTLLLLEGELRAEVEEQRFSMNAGDFVVVPADTGHRFVNTGSVTARTFTTYAPAAYPA